MGLFSWGTKKERTLDSLKRRAKVGATLTMIANNLNGTDLPLPDPILGIPRRIVTVLREGIAFDPKGPGGEPKAVVLWPAEREEGFLSLINGMNGRLAGFVDDDTFIVDYQIYYSVFKLES
jgi:hypothetical protein